MNKKVKENKGRVVTIANKESILSDVLYLIKNKHISTSEIKEILETINKTVSR